MFFYRKCLEIRDFTVNHGIFHPEIRYKTMKIHYILKLKVIHVSNSLNNTLIIQYLLNRRAFHKNLPHCIAPSQTMPCHHQLPKRNALIIAGNLPVCIDFKPSFFQQRPDITQQIKILEGAA